MKSSLFLIPFLILSCSHENNIPGPASQETSALILENQKVKFRRCYQADLNNIEEPERLKGQVEFHFSVDDTGKVIKADISSKDIKDQDLLSCMKSVLTNIDFPPSQTALPYKVSYKMDFYPKRTE